MLIEPIDLDLADGTPVRVRRIRPDDKDLLRRGFEALSPDSRARRFMRVMTRLSDAHLRYLTEVDHHDHLAWVALSRPDEEGLGVGRCVRLADGAVAEVALTVVDGWQHRGVGRLLLAVLARDALDHGISRFRAWVQPDNTPMRALIETLGGHAEHFDGGLIQVDMPLPADGAALPDTATGRLFRAVARRELPAPHYPFADRTVEG